MVILCSQIMVNTSAKAIAISINVCFINGVWFHV